MFQQSQHAGAVGIQFSASVSALGKTAQDVRYALTQTSSCLTQRDDLLLDQSCLVGAYHQDLTAIEIKADLQQIDSRNLRLAIHALQQIEAQIHDYTQAFPRHRLAIVVGTSTSGIADNEQALKAHFCGQSEQRIAHEKQEMNALAQGLQRYLNWDGIAYTISTACSSSAKAFAAGQRLLNADLADAVLVGGVDSLCKLTLNGFYSLESLSSGVCQPCGVRRDGINIGEAASLFLLSKRPSAVMLLASGESMDAWHISAPHPEGRGAQQAMQKALDAAGLLAEDIDYLNLHGTATPQNDAMEIKAVRQVFKHQPWLSSTKHQTGHCLGAAGAVEAFICQQVLQDQAWLPLHQAGEIDPELADQRYVEQPDIDQPIRYVMSNSFAFGGSNISLIFGRGDI
ncbi:beta-ketoacyl-[acyl-carrier-protein] synthase family protein [Acinetobacter sp. MD2(2019)]|uniref:beta-ketoacyl-[acyl-carrier-protein] synthase family protein n=1 Tax=Acinetobacter sp. MD2(2019) TaxID=2605273 RepID=UPI002D1F4957|nr:beta-ketoacyl-[acyl-carrier-protein] synthase family protein [Acinetobacter sp. MD2(2019)]MEB3753614.1 beta-ketoacyl-[acyl-carrier-protein] synthase family protein [Acinetobacter sp. MD2(2019)]